MKRIVKEFRTVEGVAMSVLLDNGEVLDSDLIVVGAGIIPNTKFIKGVKIEKDQSVVCDKYLQATDGLWAAGDICRFPWSFLHDEFIRIEHWGMAHYQGKITALNMVGKATVCNSVPFFWTVAYGKSIRYCGHALSYDEIIFDGKVEDLAFVGYYIKNNRVIAAVSIGRDPVVAAVAELLHTGKMPSGDDLRTGKIDVLKLH
jgi:NADPH-dependent 2,4-dienoyl-CoA reductase/sulfur reductase-like enzyme